MIAALQDLLTRCAGVFHDRAGIPHPVLSRSDLRERLAARLISLQADGVPVERPEPHFAEEVTPPLGPVFDPFRALLTDEQLGMSSEPALRQCVEAVEAVGIDGLLLLLGQRRTPASLTATDAIPPPLEDLLDAANQPCRAGGKLSVAGRAWAKHAPRSGSGFWGTVTGNDGTKSAAACQLVQTILAGATWWNVFGHFDHGTVFEARLPSGHGARWGHGGATFIGFLEPFQG